MYRNTDWLFVFTDPKHDGGKPIMFLCTHKHIWPSLSSLDWNLELESWNISGLSLDNTILNQPIFFILTCLNIKIFNFCYYDKIWCIKINTIKRILMYLQTRNIKCLKWSADLVTPWPLIVHYNIRIPFMICSLLNDFHLSCTKKSDIDFCINICIKKWEKKL